MKYAMIPSPVTQGTPVLGHMAAPGLLWPISLVQMAEVHSLNNCVLSIEHCGCSRIDAKAVGGLSTASRTSD